MIVMKFGGTSVEDAAAMRRVCAIVAAAHARKPLVVASACAGVTNALLAAVAAAGEGRGKEARGILTTLRKRHAQIADELLAPKAAEAVKESFAAGFDALGRLAESLAVIQEATPRLIDQFAACGEQWSSALLVGALNEAGTRAAFCDARTVVVTGDEFTRAEPLFDATAERARSIVLPLIEEGTIPVTQGFVGANTHGVTTTLGRGGSDYSAAILGSVLDAGEIEIWTDVDGILSADPSIVPGAKLIGEISFGEAAELAYFGAKVLHPSTILPAMKKNIPVRVLNSRRPQGGGTRITTRPAAGGDCSVKSIASKKGITVITIQSTRMLMAYGFLARVFEIFRQRKKSVDVVATSEVGVSLTVDNDADLAAIIDELEKFADVAVERGKAVCSVVGGNMKYTAGVAGRVFAALGNAGVNVELISHGGSEINLTFVIGEEEIRTAVRSLHAEFFPS